MYGYVCDRCGAYLDPGERCDCIKEQKKAAEPKSKVGSKTKKGQAVTKRFYVSGG